jgi:trehalose 6-phosphate synthase
MTLRALGQKSKSLRIGILVASVVGLTIGAMAWYQVEQERRIDTEDMTRRAHVLAHQMSSSVAAALTHPDADAKVILGDLDGYRRLVGYAVFRPNGVLLASGKGVKEFAAELVDPVQKAINGNTEFTETVRVHDSFLHILAYPIRADDGSANGVLVVLHDVSHLDDRATNRVIRSALWALLVTLLLMMLVVGATWISYDRPLHNLADWMRRVRTGASTEAPPAGLPTDLLATESDRLAASFRAARASGALESREFTREQKVWTRERLRTHAIDCLRGGQLVVVSNREPYMHQFKHGMPHLIMPAGGLVTALDPVLQACGGLWVAHGAGEADRENADANGRLTVPPHDARYTLRRVWLTREEEQGYYYGFANEAFGRSAISLTNGRFSGRMSGLSTSAPTGALPTPYWRNSRRTTRRCSFRTTS